MLLSRSLATLAALALLTTPTLAGQSESDDLSTIRGRKLTIVKDNTGAEAVTGVPRGYALIVGISNVAMATALALQLRRCGIGAGRTLVLWMVVLNGSGAFWFVALYRWLHGA